MGRDLVSRAQHSVRGTPKRYAAKPGSIRASGTMDPRSAAQHFVLRRVRETPCDMRPLHHPALLQLHDLLLAHAEFGQDLCGVFAELRRRVHRPRTRTIEPQWRIDAPHVSFGGMRRAV